MHRIAWLVACLTALLLTAPAEAQRQDTTMKAHGERVTVEHRTSHGTTTSSVASNGHARPKGATARCSDRTYTMSANAEGSCSSHGGVAKWYATARCKDGTVWMRTTKRGACRRHQGVGEWLQKDKNAR
jgi:hypothetical protein